MTSVHSLRVVRACGLCKPTVSECAHEVEHKHRDQDYSRAWIMGQTLLSSPVFQ